MKEKFLARSPLLAALALCLAACGSGGGTCPSDLPASCPSPAPSYARQVAPLIQQRCTSCHSPGGSSSSWPLDSYSDVYRLRGPVLDQVYSCRMPLGGSLDPAGRQLLLGWLVCGAPDN